MKMRPIAAMALAGTMMALAACGGGGGQSGCPSLTLSFPEGDTSLARSDRDELRNTAEGALEKCPNVEIVSYIANGDEETARMRKNHVSNMFSALFSDHFYTDERGDIDSDVIAAPSEDLAGKVKVTFAAADAE